MPHLAPCVLAPWPRRTECSDAFRCAAGVCWIGVEAHLRRAASGVVVVCGVWRMGLLRRCAGMSDERRRISWDLSRSLERMEGLWRMR